MCSRAASCPLRVFASHASCKNFFEDDLTNAARHATIRDMKTTRARRLPTGDRTSVPRLALSQQAAAPVDKSAGGGCSPSLIWQQLNLSRAGECNKGLIRAATRLGLADQFAGGEISIAAAASPALPASAIPISLLGSSRSAERRGQLLTCCQQPPLRARYCRAAKGRQAGFKVRDSQSHIHAIERKQ